MTAAQSFEVDNILNLNNNNKIATKHQIHTNGGGDKSDNMSPKSVSDEQHRNSVTPIKSIGPKDKSGASDTRASFATMNTTLLQSTESAAGKSKGEGSRIAKYGSKVNRSASASNAASNNNVEGSYHCQFCDKSFPRLGYLKKHEQVSVPIDLNKFIFFVFAVAYLKASIKKHRFLSAVCYVLVV